MKSVVIEILKPIFNIFLTTSFDQSLIHVVASSEGLDCVSFVDKSLNSESCIGVDIEIHGDDDFGSNDDRAEIRNDKCI